MNYKQIMMCTFKINTAILHLKKEGPFLTLMVTFMLTQDIMFTLLGALEAMLAEVTCSQSQSTGVEKDIKQSRCKKCI